MRSRLSLARRIHRKSLGESPRGQGVPVEVKRSRWCWAVEKTQGTHRINVALVQKPRKTSVERSFFAECPRASPTHTYWKESSLCPSFYQCTYRI